LQQDALQSLRRKDAMGRHGETKRTSHKTNMLTFLPFLDKSQTPERLHDALTRQIA
jgi:hypothetical protein